MDRGRNPILAHCAESLYLKRQYIFHTAHAEICKYISRLTVPPVFFILDLTKNTGRSIILHKGKYQVMLLQVLYISYEEASIS